jgi:hypothetical protein
MRNLSCLFLVLLVLAVAAFAAEAPKTGAIKIVGENVDLQIQTPGGVRTIAAKDGEVQLPAGSYAPVAVRLAATETVGEKGAKKDVAWTLAGKAPWGTLESITVAEGKTTELKAGAPLVVKADVQPAADGVVTIGCQILGAAGESYGPGAMKDGAAQPAPGIKILDSSGKVIASGTLAYG